MRSQEGSVESRREPLSRDLSSVACLLSLSALFIGCESEPGAPVSEAGIEADAAPPGGEVMSGEEMGGEIECESIATGLSSSDELCDEVDNDCDGEIDEGFEQLGMSCERRRMSCVSEGVFACDSEGGVSCDAQEITLSEELCDEADNDCDGEVDEGFAFLLDVEHCGRCGNACDVMNGVGRCDSGECVIGSCEAGFEDNNGDLSDGCECNRDQGELCDGIDNDCDGQIDESFGVGSGCVVGEGVCQSTGNVVCINEQQAACDALEGPSMTEICDGLDNDCDGQSDEDFDIDQDGAPSCEECTECLMSGGDECPEYCQLNDCQDADQNISPYSWDTCADMIDQNCDGADAPCTEAYARATQLSIVSATDTLGTCPDQNGDGLGDNAFSQISGIANPSIADYIGRNQMNILVGAYQFDTNRPQSRFNLSVLLGSHYRNSNPSRYLIRQTNFSDNGRPLMLFPFAQINERQLEGGPGTFMFNAPFANANGDTLLIEVPIEGAYIKGTFTQSVTDSSQFNLSNGLVSGYINKETLQESLVLLDPPIVRVIQSLITPDLDLNRDGDPDYYSICLLTTLTGVEIEIEELEPTPEPEP